jgi:hypothetical protein
VTTRFADHLLDGTHASRPAATAVPTGTLYSCSDHSLVYQSDGSAWATWATLGGGGGGSGGPLWFQRTTKGSGNTTVSSSSYGDVFAGVLDITGSAAAGDLIEVGFNLMWASDAPNGSLDVATIVSGSTVNLVGSTFTDGPGAWDGPPGTYAPVGAPEFYTVQSGDLSGGNITLRPVAKTDSGAGKTIFSNSTRRAVFWARNWGQ